MAFEEVQSLDCDVTTALGGHNRKTNKANPTKLEGYYLGTRTVDSPKSKNGKASLHIFQTAKGNVGVWGKTDLDGKMRSSVLGAMTRVSFTGMRASKNGEMYVYKVEIDKSNAVEVGAPTEKDSDDLSFSPPASSFEQDSSNEDLFYEDAVDEVVPVAPTSPLKKAVAPSAERQAQIQAMLQSRKRA